MSTYDDDDCGAPSAEEPSCRLSVNLAPDVAAALEAVAAGRGISITEAVRRAISLLWFVDDVYLRGSRIMVVDGADNDAELREVVYP